MCWPQHHAKGVSGPTVQSLPDLDRHARDSAPHITSCPSPAAATPALDFSQVSCGLQQRQAIWTSQPFNCKIFTGLKVIQQGHGRLASSVQVLETLLRREAHPPTNSLYPTASMPLQRSCISTRVIAGQNVKQARKFLQIHQSFYLLSCDFSGTRGGKGCRTVQHTGGQGRPAALLVDEEIVVQFRCRHARATGEGVAPQL